MTTLFGVCTAAFFFMSMVILLKIWKVRKRDDDNPLPGGSMGWPFIGETLEFVSCAYSSRPESFMDKRRLIYGKVFKSHIFGSPTVVSTDPEVSKFVLQSDARTFVPSYPRSLMELMGKSSILLINGSLQRRVHGLIGSFLKSPHLKSQITQDMHKYVDDLMGSWEDDQLVYVQDETKQISFQLLVRGLMSLEPGEDMQFLKQQFRIFIAGLMSLPARKRMVKLIRGIIKERRKKADIVGSGFAPRDVLDVLLGDNYSDQLTDELISDNMIDLMIPGEDSVPLLMTLAVKYLSDCPTALKQLEVITETLRLGNIIYGTMRKAMRDVEVKGYLIPKGWCVLTYFRSVHLDETHYADPYGFSPWRWQGKDSSTTCNFTPFGGGQRLCPGLDLARLEASVFLHHLVTRFTWVAEEDTIVNFPTVRMKGRMPVRVRRK
ncbi:hypothetical protein Taro_007298 [Colocasia esculenta]|uniref:Uncharacterized protein n=1 Tax=Colocasia esculenta TaxID=4460 RepID=A0A843TXS0_COLES|nr:hypothetical protein [Colocasia esculenta]